jgi:CRISPR type III-B/RAMP module RAMP protein Cmr6
MTKITRRKNIQRIIGENFNAQNVNASLWLDKFIFESIEIEKGKSEASYKPGNNKDETAKTALVNQVVKIPTPTIYEKFFNETWLPGLQNHGAKCRKATVKNRLAINLGAESVLETNISLHRVFGVPFIPGSALKGLVAHFLQNYGGEDWKATSENYITVFGNQDSAGFITFHDALLFVPKDSIGKRSLYADIMTTHHSEYYAKNNRTSPPADWDSPNPVPFISATGDFLIALSGPSDWVKLTFKILEYALQVEGVGAKTSSGYGRMFFSGGFILSELEAVENQNAIAKGLISEMSKLLSQDKKIRKDFSRKLKEATNGLDINNPIDLGFAKEIAQEVVKLDLKDKLEKQDPRPDWFNNVTNIIPLNDTAAWIVEPRE